MRLRVVNGSMRVMVPARASATHTAPSPNATAVGSPETLISGPLSPVSLNRATAPVCGRATHTPPAPGDSARFAGLRVPLAEPRVVADVDHVPPSVREPGVPLRIDGRTSGGRPLRSGGSSAQRPGVDPPDPRRVTDPTARLATATELGPGQQPGTGPEGDTRSASGKTCTTWRASPSATHGDPASPAAMSVGVAPRRTVLRTRLVRASTRVNVREATLDTHTHLPLTTTFDGVRPTGIGVPSCAPVRGSMATRELGGGTGRAAAPPATGEMRGEADRDHDRRGKGCDRKRYETGRRTARCRDVMRRQSGADIRDEGSAAGISIRGRLRKRPVDRGRGGRQSRPAVEAARPACAPTTSPPRSAARKGGVPVRHSYSRHASAY